jgi:hypothetical protein
MNEPSIRTKPRRRRKSKRAPLADPMQFRPDAKTEEMLNQLRDVTPLEKQEIVRRALGFALPKFLSGEVPLVTVPTV